MGKITVDDITDWEDENEEDGIIYGPFDLEKDEYYEETINNIINRVKVTHNINISVEGYDDYMDKVTHVTNICHDNNLTDEIRTIFMEEYVNTINKYEIEIDF